MKKIKDYIEVFLKGARLNFQMFGSVAPVFACVIDDQVKIFDLAWNCPEDKDQFAQNVQDLIANDTIKDFVMVTEAWAASSNKDDITKVRQWLEENGTLQNYPERYEIVNVQYSSAEEEIIYTAKIKRTGSKTILEDWNSNTKTGNFDLFEISSRFQGLFPKGKANLN